LRVLGYLGHRIIEQYLSIPVGSQAAPGSSGGVVDLNRNFGGADARWSWQGLLADQPITWVMGAAYDRQNELRRGYNNFIGNILGVQGALRRDENDIVDDIDEYAQGTWDFAPQWSLMAGVRHSDVQFQADDHLVSATNPNDSGSVAYGSTSPVAGLTFKALTWLHLYASYGQGFQTPLGSELAYRPDGTSGLNFGLQPARNTTTELGVKVQLTADLNATADVFHALTHDEIVVDTNIGGRSTYQNSNRTRRQGAEYSLDYRFAPRWHAQIAYTYLEANYVDAYLTCVAAPCAHPTAVVPAGNGAGAWGSTMCPGIAAPATPPDAPSPPSPPTKAAGARTPSTSAAAAHAPATAAGALRCTRFTNRPPRGPARHAAWARSTPVPRARQDDTAEGPPRRGRRGGRRSPRRDPGWPRPCSGRPAGGRAPGRSARPGCRPPRR